MAAPRLACRVVSRLQRVADAQIELREYFLRGHAAVAKYVDADDRPTILIRVSSVTHRRQQQHGQADEPYGQPLQQLSRLTATISHSSDFIRHIALHPREQ